MDFHSYRAAATCPSQTLFKVLEARQITDCLSEPPALNYLRHAFPFKEWQGLIVRTTLRCQASSRKRRRDNPAATTSNLASRSGNPELPFAPTVLSYHKLAGTNGPASADRAASPETSAPQATLNQPAIHLAQPPLRDYVGPESYSSMILGIDKIDQLKTEPALPLDQGIAPSKIFSQVTSTALASNRSTPVPQPVDRQQLVISRRKAPPHLMAGSMTPTPTHPLAPMNEHLRCRGVLLALTPYNQLALCGRETSVDTKMPAQDKLTTMSNIFQGQWLLFVNAKEASNFWLMRIALNQAISTPRHHHQPLRYAEDDGDIQWLVGQRQAGEDGTIIPNSPPPTATQASYHTVSHRSHSCGETASCFPGLYATSRPSSVSANSAATVTSLHAAAASSQRAQSPPPWQETDGSASSTRADDTRYWTPARHLPTRPEGLPAPSLPRAGGVLRTGTLKPAAATSTPKLTPRCNAAEREVAKTTEWLHKPSFHQTTLSEIWKPLFNQSL
ncbi:hypothetical protein PCANC_25139 [Puccinia coronata f. sp. avenae]|uniref:Uncharacterized protein n=1 Tax=Puccinia coronata f. sp. avenae TaxID=200324 RepID=A0A2N5U0Q7_9BASI|nr:hypothetical protein PCANC_25139 [Puccinia coronata f. sp. avenae]